MPRKDRDGASAFAVGLIVLVVVVVVTYFGFTKHIPFTHGFRVKAVFQSANSIRPNSPVRIAGVNVGKVTSIERHAGHRRGDRDDGDQRHGPADPQGRDGQDPAAHLPRGQLLRRPRSRARRRRRRSTTATRCRSARPPRRSSSTRCSPRCSSDTRTDLKRARAALGRRRSTYKPTRGGRRRRRPARPRPDRGGVAERLDPLRAAPRCAARPIVNDALHRARSRTTSRGLIRGPEPDDRGPEPQRGRSSRTSSRTSTRRWRRRRPRRRTCGCRSAGSAPTLQSAERRARQPQRRVPEHARVRPRDPAGRPRDAGDDRRRLPVDRAGPRAARAGRAAGARRRAQPGDERPRARSSTRASTCSRRPTSSAKCLTARRPADRRHQDPGRPALDRRGELQGVLVHDGRPRRRGPELRRQRPVRALPAGRRRPDRLARHGERRTSARCSATRSPSRSARGRASPASRPPYKPDVPCYTQTLPDLNGAADRPRGRADAMRQAIRKHTRDFAFIVGLVVHRAGRRRLHPVPPALHLPRGVPVVGSDFVALQGRVLDRAGGHAGPGPDGPGRRRRRRRDLEGRRSSDGRAVVDDEDPAEVHADLQRRDRAAAPEDRPERHDRRARRRARRARATRREGYTIPVSQTLPNVNLDEILAALDADTRDYLQLLDRRRRRRASTARAGACRRTLKRFEPTGRDLARINGALAAPPGEHPPHDPQLPAAGARRSATRTTSSRRSSTPPTACSGRSPPRTRACARRCSCCPARSSTTNTALQKADALGVDARPARSARCGRPPRALGPALQQVRPFFADTTPMIREPAAAVRARRRCRRSRDLRPAAARPRGRDAAADDVVRRPQPRCSTSSPTTRRARRRASCSGVVGEPRRRDGLHRRRTRTARSAAGSS